MTKTYLEKILLKNKYSKCEIIPIINYGIIIIFP